MDRRGILIGLGFAVALAGCGELHKLAKLHFDVTKNLAVTTIPGSLTPCSLTSNLPFTFLGNPFTITMSQQQDFPQQNTDVQHVTSAHLTQLTLALTSTSGQQSWDFLEDLTLYAEANGQTKAVVASIGIDSESATPVPAGATTLTLVPTSLDLAPYIKASGGFSITSDATGCPPSQDADFGGVAKFHITADPLN